MRTSSASTATTSAFVMMFQQARQDATARQCEGLLCRWGDRLGRLLAGHQVSDRAAPRARRGGPFAPMTDTSPIPRRDSRLARVACRSPLASVTLAITLLGLLAGHLHHRPRGADRPGAVDRRRTCHRRADARRRARRLGWTCRCGSNSRSMSGDALQGDLGTSIRTGRRCREEIGAVLPGDAGTGDAGHHLRHAGRRARGRSGRHPARHHRRSDRAAGRADGLFDAGVLAGPDRPSGVLRPAGLGGRSRPPGPGLRA